MLPLHWEDILVWIRFLDKAVLHPNRLNRTLWLSRQKWEVSKPWERECHYQPFWHPTLVPAGLHWGHLELQCRLCTFRMLSLGEGDGRHNDGLHWRDQQNRVEEALRRKNQASTFGRGADRWSKGLLQEWGRFELGQPQPAWQGLLVSSAHTSLCSKSPTAAFWLQMLCSGMTRKAKKKNEGQQNIKLFWMVSRPGPQSSTSI